MKTRDILKKVDWDCSLKILFREENLGCGRAVSEAISWFYENVEHGIILEDDCLPDLSFFKYCEEMLLKYKDVRQVMHINGNNFQHGMHWGEAGYYFSYYPHIWGWATWRRAWKMYEYEMKDFYQTYNSGGLDHVFFSNSEKQYWKKIFTKTFMMQTNTWDYQWTYCIWKNKGLSITPNLNLVINLGLRDNSSHTFLFDSSKNDLCLSGITFPIRHPDFIVNHEADNFTFENSFSHSGNRILRLIMENGFIRVAKYVIAKYAKRND